MKKVALGLSGGVDSAVSALLLKQQGYDTHCIYLSRFDEDVPGCRTKEDRKDALAVALHLGLPFQVLDFKKEYQASVIDYFKREYLAGRTPNPDVVCNRDIKFGLFYDWALRLAPLAQGKRFDYIATGHYARSTPSLSQPEDFHKDQTYFLWQVPRERFQRVLFPLGDYLKTEVRKIARASKLPVADKEDSTGICFIGEVRVEDFLKRLGVKEKPGDVVDTSGRVIGRHRGVIFYTIGQRHGFEIFGKPGEGDRTPLYVIHKGTDHNRLVVGFGAETYRDHFVCDQLNWQIPDPMTEITNLTSVRIRHGGALIPCTVKMVGNHIGVSLADGTRGVSPGQSAVFYLENGIVLGGGIIQ